MKRPAFQFYPADWRKDSALQSTSIAARGLWIEMTCIMHECDPYGHLAVNGNPLQEAQLSRLVGESVAIVKKLLVELESAGVFSRLENGCIYSRRMVKDEQLRNVRAEAGRLGGNPNLVKQKVKQKSNQTGKQSPTPSSSSSSSPSGNSVPNGTGGEPPAGQNETPKTPEEMTKTELWRAGKSLLLESGMPKDQCGTFVGKLCKDYGDDIVIEAVRSAVVQRPADPPSFLKSCCMARKGEGGKTLIPWHATDAGVLAKGVELSLTPRAGETMLQFKARLIAAIDNGGKPPEPKSGPVVVVKTDELRPLKPDGIAPLKSLVKLRERA